jgi:hypothetical protein
MKITEAPFKHGTIDGFLPDDLYQDVLRDWPDRAALSTVSLPQGEDLASSSYLGSRKTKLLENWADENRNEVATWNRLSLSLREQNFVRALFTRFSGVIEDNLIALNPSRDSVVSFKLYANFDQGEKEALGAHVDALRKLLTIVVYLDLEGPLNEASSELWGTTLYEADGDAIKPVRFSSNSDHRVGRKIAFSPNRAFVMPNTSSALHGVTGGQKGVMRRTLMCGYWLMAPR